MKTEQIFYSDRRTDDGLGEKAVTASFEVPSYPGYIGVFDSGVGGISVLAEIRRRLPGEDLLFFGDSANAPYGEKTPEQVLELTGRAIGRMITFQGVKAVVIACNTATSAAAAVLRERYPEVPIIGVEPAVKPAAMAVPGGRILVMATPVTLGLEKYHLLHDRLKDQAEIISLACPGLAWQIEQGDPDSYAIRALLRELLEPWRGQVDAVVLGCTHYPFIRKQIQEVIGEAVPMFDSAEGTARELARVLQTRQLLKSEKPEDTDRQGNLVFATSSPKPGELELYQRFLLRTDV